MTTTDDYVGTSIIADYPNRTFKCGRGEERTG